MFKKIIILTVLVLAMTSCGGCKTTECFNWQIELQRQHNINNANRAVREAEQLKLLRDFELKLQQIENESPVRQEVNAIEKWNESLDYMKKSQQTRDVIEWVSMGYSIFKTLSE